MKLKSARLLALVSALTLAASAAAVARPQPAGAGNAVTQWNAVALEVLPVDPGLLLDSRAFAVLHAAIHDAVNGIERRYQPYTADLSSPGASVDAAIAAAARDVLVALSPSQSGRIGIAYAVALGAVPNGPAKDAGIALGQQSAAQNLARRVGDGADEAAEPVYVPTGQPGDYAFTPPFDGPLGPVALFPGWGRVRPFGINLAEHRLRGPASLSSPAYAADFNTLKEIGSLNSRLRTPEQTDIAFFWFEFSPIGWNRIANTVVRQTHADVWKAARVMALVNFAIADGYIAGFEGKYDFRFWRPSTAIQKADTDGNPDTLADPTWRPLLSTPPSFIPPVPDYPSTHTVLGAAAAEVLARHFNDRTPFAATSSTLLGVTRHYGGFREAAVENGLSRVYGGIHFGRAVQDGYELGQGIGRSVSGLLPPVRR